MISGAEVDDFPLVAAWPMVLGCDASGTVVEVGKEAESIFKVGDRVCGCTRLGETGYGTFQEYVRLLILKYERERRLNPSDWNHAVSHGRKTGDSDPQRAIL